MRKTRSQILKEILEPPLVWRERNLDYGQKTGHISGSNFSSCTTQVPRVSFNLYPLITHGLTQIFASSKRNQGWKKLSKLQQQRNANENWCYNLKSGYYVGKINVRFYNYASRAYQQFVGDSHWPTGLDLNILAKKNYTRNIFGPLGPGTDPGFSSRAYWTMLPRFKDQYTLLQQICELKDFKEGIKDFSGAIQSLKAPLELMSSNMVSPKSLKRRKYADATDYWLAYALAIRPTVSSVMDALVHLKKVVEAEQLKFGIYGKSRSHYSEWLRRDKTAIKVWSLYYPYREQFRADTIKRTATMITTYDYEMRSSLDALFSYWGLRMSSQLIWELVTLSFLADYWIKIGNTISAMDNDKNVTIKSMVMSESSLIASTSGFHNHDWDSICYNNSIVGPNDLQAGVFQSFYRRAPVIPVKAAARPRLTLPTGLQSLTSACVAFSMMK